MVIGFWSCSSEKNNFASKTYHNTTARYNAYFIAKENMDEVENAIEESHDNNFNKILKVFSDVDSSTIRGVDAQLEDCIKKSSLAIQRHSNSKWVDNSYILVGKSRYYAADFVNAIETFKYVNTKSEDDNARQEALIWLMRTFIDYNEENNAIAVSDYLKKEDLNASNMRFLGLTRAYYYQQKEDYESMMKQLVEIAPGLSKKENADRIYFIIAQVYQDMGLEAEAYTYYNLCLKSNPRYELYFYSRLYLAQVSELADEGDIKKIRKYFKKLLRDRKNEEFQDKIYYEMANFEIKQGNFNEAIDYYKSSVKESVRNPRQKAYSYLKLGELYYDHFKNYKLAKNYYDSTVAVLPQDDELYFSVAERQVILENFVEQVNTIQLQDSLLNLAEMDTTELYAYLDQVIDEQNQRAEEELARQKKKESNVAYTQTNIYDPFPDNSNQLTASSGAIWYFYNTSAVSLGQSEFRRIWGDRKLDDDWRRSVRTGSTPFTEESADDLIEQAADSVTEVVAINNDDARSNLLNTIPFSDEAKQSALAKVENAYYNLGNIYNFDLYEKDNAIESFEILLERFPDTEYEPEVLYLLYLICKEQEDEKYIKYGDVLVEKFPKTTFAKLVKNPNYKEDSNVASEKLKVYYKEAYEFFMMDSLEAAKNLIIEGNRLYPDNSFSDNMKLLEIMIWAKTDGLYKYQYELQNFEDQFPESDLLEFVNHLLASSKEHQEAMIKQKAVQYIPYFDQVHFFVVVYPSEITLSDQIPKLVDQFNLDNFSGDRLSSGNLIFDDEKSLLLVNEFKDNTEAIAYYSFFNSEESPLNDFESFKFYNFVISKDNFQILYQTKGLQEYLNFFKKNY